MQIKNKKNKQSRELIRERVSSNMCGLVCFQALIRQAGPTALSFSHVRALDVQFIYCESQRRADVHWATSSFTHEKVRFQDIYMTRNSEQQSERGERRAARELNCRCNIGQGH